eukprot:7243912-Prymnesium_polylepis.1
MVAVARAAVAREAVKAVATVVAAMVVEMVEEAKAVDLVGQEVLGAGKVLVVVAPVVVEGSVRVAEKVGAVVT